ncbi:MAG: LamB/YcsF family protein [Clostridia bacterium]
MEYIDLNADMGESFGAWTMGLDARLLPSISSANIACGWHAGDPVVMQTTVSAAMAAGVAIGAHPGYPDLAGFGRRSMALSPDEAYSAILYQAGALRAFAEAAGGRLSHVKPHGAMYNDAAVNPTLAGSIAKAVQALGGGVYLVGLPDCELSRAAEELGLPYAREFFADRAYDESGHLVPRSKPGAVIHDRDLAVSRTLAAIRTGTVTSITGKAIPSCFDTICLHGDNPEAVDFARALRAALESGGIAVTSFKPDSRPGALP